MHRTRSRRRRARRPSRAGAGGAARRSRRRRSLPRRRRAGRGGDLRAGQAVCVRPHARALERLLGDELRERAQNHERAARLLTGAGEASDRIAVHLLAARPGGNAETVNTLRQAAKGARNRGAPDVAVKYLQESACGTAVGGARTGACPRVGQGRAQRRRARARDRAAPAGNSRFRRRWAARGSGERARFGSLPCTAAGAGDDRSHGGHRRVTGERARAGAEATGDALGGHRGAALRSGVVSRQQGSGSSSSPAHRGRSESACRSLRQRTTPLERGRRPRHASWPCRRSLTGGCSKIRVRSRAGSGSHRSCSFSPTPMTTWRGSAPR